MQQEALHAVARLLRDTRWAALATVGAHGPLATQVAWNPACRPTPATCSTTHAPRCR